MPTPTYGTNVASLVFNSDQTDAYDKFVAHANREWAKQRGSTPSAAELRKFLAHCHVWALDVEQGGLEEREALQTLRTSVITDPGQADAAWHVLLSTPRSHQTHARATDLYMTHISPDILSLRRPVNHRAPRRQRGTEDLGGGRGGVRRSRGVRGLRWLRCAVPQLCCVGDEGSEAMVVAGRDTTHHRSTTSADV